MLVRCSDHVISVMQSKSKTIENYIRAKDENRPHLLRDTFCSDAVLDMIVSTNAISFPPRVQGRDAIARVLVQDFGRANENVYTFCLSAPPQKAGDRFDCHWLVGMSDKVSGQIRIGCGTYSWIFRTTESGLVEKLTIAIDLMELLLANKIGMVMQWLTALPYPWCPPTTVLEAIPNCAELRAVRQYLEDCSGQVS